MKYLLDEYRSATFGLLSRLAAVVGGSALHRVSFGLNDRPIKRSYICC